MKSGGMVVVPRQIKYVKPHGWPWTGTETGQSHTSAYFWSDLLSRNRFKRRTRLTLAAAGKSAIRVHEIRKVTEFRRPNAASSLHWANFCSPLSVVPWSRSPLSRLVAIPHSTLRNPHSKSSRKALRSLRCLMCSEICARWSVIP